VIPQKALLLMADKTPVDVFDDMIQQNGLPKLQALTFGIVITPIIFNATGEIVGYVIFWHNNFCSVHTLKDDWLTLLGMEIHEIPTRDEATALFEKYYTNHD